ncbi:hypothetical protein Hypma_015890 [Hypsizygus marmoreus]|uniref:Uncharacterized protein n=1 Tax=Hypsizygus marmoreus TaxID=39966 RepID=A0A369KEE5_HYPMA|nr:hypothetical protein Hypma_015890 [Hypsizygus marmoreus]
MSKSRHRRLRLAINTHRENIPRSMVCHICKRAFGLQSSFTEFPVSESKKRSEPDLESCLFCKAVTRQLTEEEN